MVLGQNVGDESPYPVGFSDCGQTSEQCSSDSPQVILVGNHDRDVGSGRVVVGDLIVRYTNQSVPVERTKSALAGSGRTQLGDEFIQMYRIQREKA